MAQIIQGPWKPFRADAVTKIPTGTWSCTIIKLRPRKQFPSEASLSVLKNTRSLPTPNGGAPGKSAMSPAS
jgi:hypothetical protein